MNKIYGRYRSLFLPFIGLISAGCTHMTEENTSGADIDHKHKHEHKLVAPSQQHIKAYTKHVPFREDDFAWENDLVAFRMYGPSSSATSTNSASGVDCLLKRVNYTILDKWYENFRRGISYHTDWGEGYDPYHTGTSRGAGGTALWIDGAPHPARTYSAWRSISDDENRVEFELDYHWHTKLGEVSETKRISLALGSQLYQVTSTFLLDGKPAKNLHIAIGVTTHDEAASTSKNQASGWISAWENIHDHHLGTGVVVSPQHIEKFIHQKSDNKDESHIWVIARTNNDGQLTYAAGYAWELANNITTEQEWHDYLSHYSFVEPVRE